ncbi:uncharacterized mitochondrial protein AtMg00820-like [Nicotiana tomentosiformis]|uniref:uncharacterized mitochondrial protein AtMg00820-like n=1 Tax=Nicotiana tomentosiformis TaxID=4098 RepID=UPI00388C6F78
MSLHIMLHLALCNIVRILNLNLLENVDKGVIWPKWQEGIQSMLNSLSKREVFKHVVQTPNGIKHVGYKWVFVRKRNEKNEVQRYKARLVAQGFSQRPGVDYEETYSPIMDAITYHYLISFGVHEKLGMHLMDVVTSYL